MEVSDIRILGIFCYRDTSMERVGGGVLPTVDIRSRKVQISSFLWTELQ